MFAESYTILDRNKWALGNYSIVPIRYEDRMEILKWRNEQIYHLRQPKPLTEEDQDNYFKNIVAQLFEQNNPSQILFSYLEGEKCIGYGGLVHINWIDKHAEISFLMNTELEEKTFEFHWKMFLSLIEQLAFDELNFHKIFTYAFDLRPKLYTALNGAKFKHEATFKEHCFFDEKFIDVLIHAKFNPYINYRAFNKDDKTFIYAVNNEKGSRANSFYPAAISPADHDNWFSARLNDNNTVIDICEINNNPIGIVRFQKEGEFSTVGINLIHEYRSKGLAKKMLRDTCKRYHETNQVCLLAYIKEDNIASIKTFEKAGFIFKESTIINQFNAVVYKLDYND